MKVLTDDHFFWIILTQLKKEKKKVSTGIFISKTKEICQTKRKIILSLRNMIFRLALDTNFFFSIYVYFLIDMQECIVLFCF